MDHFILFPFSMTNSGEPNSEVLARLSVEIQATLKRKSSRDPNSRFTSKLSSFLAYVSTVPTSETEIGVVWVTDDTFKMNKKILANILGMKLNTLNVNLRDLKFEAQAYKVKDGWTLWKREGFTRTTQHCEEQTEWQFAEKPANRLPFNLGCISPDFARQFFQNAEGIWRELTNFPVISPCHTQGFLVNTARRFKQEGQNAFEVLSAIISPRNLDIVTFEQIAKFMAMFGPEKTVILKKIGRAHV
jgi:hypothetical protein